MGLRVKGQEARHLLNPRSHTGVMNWWHVQQNCADRSYIDDR